MNVKKVVSLLLALSLIVMSFAGCGGTTPPETPPASGGSGPAESETTFGLTPLDKRTTLRVGFFSGSAHGMPFYIADQMGFFDELNIDVEYESFIGGPAMMEANASWDICDVGGPGVLNGMKNYDIRMIGICDNEANTALFVRPDSELAKDPDNAELWKGKTVILNSGTTLQYMFASYLESIGGSINDVTIVSMDVTSGLTAFKAGEADAVCAWNAVAYNAEDMGLVRVTDMGRMMLNNICGLCATPAALKDKTELINLAWMVYYMTWEWCQESPDNMDKAVELYVESCEEEGVNSNESICRRALEVFNCPPVAEIYKQMTVQEPDRSGSDDRAAILSKGLIDSSVAAACADTLKELKYIS